MRNNSAKSFLQVIAMIAIALPINTLAWNDKVTHRDISQYASEQSLLKTDEYIYKIGYANGLRSALEWDGLNRMVWQWLAEEGSVEEDTVPRWLNHFHDPLVPWTNAGLRKLVTWESTVLWAQDYKNNDKWSWQKTRNYYYSALTAEIKSTRDAYFAQTFRGLGQQIHLLQEGTLGTLVLTVHNDI